jgi:hypothetical protein
MTQNNNPTKQEQIIEKIILDGKYIEYRPNSDINRDGFFYKDFFVQSHYSKNFFDDIQIWLVVYKEGYSLFGTTDQNIVKLYQQKLYQKKSEWIKYKEEKEEKELKEKIDKIYNQLFNENASK